MRKIRHFGWQVSPYSAKTRSYLRYAGVEFQDVSPILFTFVRKIQPAIGDVAMPTVELENGRCLKDSSKITDYFESRGVGPSVIPVTAKSTWHPLANTAIAKLAAQMPGRTVPVSRADRALSRPSASYAKIPERIDAPYTAEANRIGERTWLRNNKVTGAMVRKGPSHAIATGPCENTSMRTAAANTARPGAFANLTSTHGSLRRQERKTSMAGWTSATNSAPRAAGGWGWRPPPWTGRRRRRRATREHVQDQLTGVEPHLALDRPLRRARSRRRRRPEPGGPPLSGGGPPRGRSRRRRGVGASPRRRNRSPRASRPPRRPERPRRAP